MARALEAPQHLPRPAAVADRRGRRAACTRRSTRRSPRPGGCRRRARTSSRSRSAPSSAARSARRSSPRRATGCSRPTTRRSSCGSSRTCRASRSCARRSRAARTSTARPPPRCSARTRGAHDRPALDREDDQLRDRLRDLGVRARPRTSRSPREAQRYIDAYLARFPHVQDFIARTIEQATRDGYVTSLLGRRRPVPEIRASNRQTRSLRRAGRGQLRHAGLERRHHQGGDDPHPRAACARRGEARGSCCRCTTSSCSKCPSRRSRR